MTVALTITLDLPFTEAIEHETTGWQALPTKS